LQYSAGDDEFEKQPKPEDLQVMKEFDQLQKGDIIKEEITIKQTSSK